MTQELTVAGNPGLSAPGDAFLSVIAAAARDPQVDVTKMQQLLEMVERVKARDAEVAFHRAMGAAQSEILPVVRDAENTETRKKYARLETIDAKIRPIYTRHGFSLSFNSAPPAQPGAARIICHVSHEQGHSARYELEGDLDITGPKGTRNKTSIQGLGSSVSYLRRYLTLMIFNVALKDEDNDGAKTSAYLSEQQVSNIRNLLNEAGLPEDNAAFLAWAGAARIEQIQAVAYERVAAELTKRIAKKREGR